MRYCPENFVILKRGKVNSDKNRPKVGPKIKCFEFYVLGTLSVLDRVQLLVIEDVITATTIPKTIYRLFYSTGILVLLDDQIAFPWRMKNNLVRWILLSDSEIQKLLFATEISRIFFVFRFQINGFSILKCYLYVIVQFVPP